MISRMMMYVAIAAGLMGRVAPPLTTRPLKPTNNKKGPKKARRSNSRYTPHQGPKECARRVRQMRARESGSIMPS